MNAAELAAIQIGVAAGANKQARTIVNTTALLNAEQTFQKPAVDDPHYGMVSACTS